MSLFSCGESVNISPSPLISFSLVTMAAMLLNVIPLPWVPISIKMCNKIIMVKIEIIHILCTLEAPYKNSLWKIWKFSSVLQNTWKTLIGNCIIIILTSWYSPSHCLIGDGAQDPHCQTILLKESIEFTQCGPSSNCHLQLLPVHTHNTLTQMMYMSY